MLGMLSELAALAGMPSEPTLRKMIREDPDFQGIVKRGSNGDAYEIDIPVAVAYIMGLEAKKAAAIVARQQDLAQVAMDLGLSASAPTPGLTLADRKAMLEEEVVALKLSRMRGELVSKASVEATIGQLLVWFQQQGASFSARLAKRADVPRALQIEIDRMVEADQAALARRMQSLAEVGTDGDGNDDTDIVARAPLDDPAL